MKAALCLALSVVSFGDALSQTSVSAPAAAAAYGKLPLSFEANRGQVDSQVRFSSRGNGYALFLTDREAVLALTKSNVKQFHAHMPAKTDVVRMQLVGGFTGPTVSGEQQLPGTANYFVGSDAANWHANVPTYAKVRYSGAYPGIDLVYYGNQRRLEYDFVVAPDADPKLVKLHFAGAEKLKLTPAGDLMVKAQHGQVEFHKPVVWQPTVAKLDSGSPSGRIPVEGKFVLLAGNVVGFSLGSYDRKRELVIDPVLEYSTYLGGTGPDEAFAIAVDSAGSAYVTGYTYSTKFPTTSSAYQKTNVYTTNTGQSAVYVSKFNASGTGLLYSTYLTGTAYHCNAGINGNAPSATGDFGAGIAVNASGDAFITGGTCANDFPTTKGAFQTVDTGAYHHATNAFITKLNSAGSGLVYSTYLGGQGSGFSGDWGNAIAVDSSGDAYVTGQTSSPNFPTLNAFQATNENAGGENNAFVAKLNSTGTALVYSTYLGGSGDSRSPYGDSGNAIAINSAGNAYITGYTCSNNFPLTASTAYQTTNKAYAIGGSSPFVTEFSTDGKSLVYSTYLGGSTIAGNLNDSGNGIAVDKSGNIYVGGGTASADFPTTANAFQKTAHRTSNLANGFVTKLNPASKTLVYSTFLGGSGNTNGPFGDRVEALALDGSGNVYLTGYTGSNNFPLTSSPYQSTNKTYANHSETAFFTELNATGSSEVYSTYLGGSGSASNNFGDYGAAIAYAAGGVYLAGSTLSSNFPSVHPFQKTLAAASGNTNAFVAKFEFATASKTTLVSDGDPQKLGVKVTFTADVTASTGSVAPTGTVSFSIDGGAAVKVALDDTGHAAYAISSLTEGVHSVGATYSGDDLSLASSASLSETIYGAATAIAVVSGSGQTGVINSPFAKPLVVILKDAKGDVVPGATITFSGAGLKFSSTTVTTGTNGEASVTATPTSTGTLTATATDGSMKTTFTLTGTNGTVSEPVPQSFAIAEATAGATVYYTTNGATPTTASTKYTAPIVLSKTTTLKFIAVKTGYTSSAVRTVVITVE